MAAIQRGALCNNRRWPLGAVVANGHYYPARDADRLRFRIVELTGRRAAADPFLCGGPAWFGDCQAQKLGRW